MVNDSPKDAVPGISWVIEKAWCEAHQTLGLLFKRYALALDPVKEAARRAEHNMNLLSPVFDDFSARVCPDCTAPCCRKARVGYDFKDLLLMHALDLTPPPHQLQRDDSEPCRYLGPTGCLLPRIIRPFICTWYYCAPMLELLREMPPKRQRHLSALMTGIQTERNYIEEVVIRVVTEDLAGSEP